MYDANKICLCDLRDTIWNGYQVRLFMYELLGTSQFYWYSPWQAISTGNQTTITIPYNVLDALPNSDYDLYLEASNNGGTSYHRPFLSKGTLHLTADSGVTISGWGYSMTVYTVGAANSAGYYQTGPTTHYLTVTDTFMGFSGFSLTNHSGRTITSNDVRMHIEWTGTNGVRYYARCRVQKDAQMGGWSVANGATLAISTVVLNSDYPKIGVQPYGAVSFYLEVAVLRSGTTDYVYSRITDVVTLNILRMNGEGGLPVPTT